MKKTRWAVWALSVAALFSGCKGFWDAPSGGGGGGGGGTASGVFYVLNQKTAQVAAFSFSTGTTITLNAITGSPYTIAAAPFAMALSPNGNFLYVSSAAGIYLYNVGSTGALTLSNNGQVISADPAYSMQVDPTGQWLIEAVSGMGTVNAIPLSTTTGAYNGNLQEAEATLPSANVQQLAVSPANSATPYVFVAMGASGTAVVPFTAANAKPFGGVARIVPKGTLGGATSVAVDPGNKLLYVGETVAVSGTQTGGLRVFTIGASQISEISGSPFATGGTGPSAILATASNVYVANKAVSGSSVGNITGFTVASNAGTYSLTKVNTVNAGSGPTGLAKENTSTYLLAVNYGGNPDLSAYTFDATTAGQLNAGPKAATGSDPVQAVAVVALP